MPIQEGQLTLPDKIYWYKIDFSNYDLSFPETWLLRIPNYDKIEIYYRNDDKNSTQIKKTTLYKRSEEFNFADNFLFNQQQLIKRNLLYARVKQKSKTMLLSDVVCQNAYKVFYNQNYYPTDVFHLQIFYYIFIGGLCALLFIEVAFMMLGAAIEVFVFSLGMGYRIKKIEEQKKSVENEIIKVQLIALKAQMNPHFLLVKK